jgi:transposase
MDVIAELKRDVCEGRIDVARLIELIAHLQRQLHTTNQQNQELLQQNQELQKQIDRATPAKLDEPFSLRAEEQRQQARGKKKAKRLRQGRRGRVTTADKIAQAERTEPVFPEGVAPSDCHWSHTRPVWRLEQGRAVLIAYAIYRGPHNQYGRIPGVLGRSEFGLEIVVTIAFLVYSVGLSFDKVCLILSFFQNLKLQKSQADALLYQLSRHWHNEFEILCTLLANSLIVHTDETSWSLNSVWAFLSEKARVLLFGVPKDADTLKVLLDPETFAGIVSSDDAAIYAQFTHAQKCWAHLLRKAIKLTLHDPHNEEYRQFLDRLLAIYRAACRVQQDGRLSDAGRTRKVAELDDALLDLCGPLWAADLPPLEGLDNDYRLLTNEVVRLMLAQELFTFVTAPPVEQPNGETQQVGATNNESERTLRAPAEARKTGRTNKTRAGARRQTIVTSVLESLRLYLRKFTLTSVLAEIHSWVEKGRSCFTELLEKLEIPSPEQSVLDRVLPCPSG